MKRIITFLIVAASFLPVFAYNRAIVDSLERELSKVTTLEDSLRISFDIFDSSSRGKQYDNARRVLDLASRSGDENAQLSILRSLSTLDNVTDSLFNEYLDIASGLKRSEIREQTILFIKVKQNSEAARTSTVEQSRQRVRELMKRVEVSQGLSIYTRLEVLFTLCAYIEQVSTGELLTDHLQQVGELLDELPDKLDALESLYLTQSSLTYTAMQSLQKAIDADKRLLEHVDQEIGRAHV